MDIKKLVLFGLFAIIFKTDASELTPELQYYLDRDTTGIVEHYVYDGTIKLDPRHCAGTLGDMCGRLNQKQIRQLHAIFDHQYASAIKQALASVNLDRDSAAIIFEYLEHRYGERQVVDSVHFIPIILAISEQHNLSQDSIPPAIARLYVKNKKVGDKIVVTDEHGKEYDFKLAQDRKATMEQVMKWPKSFSQELIACGFDGSHAQMERFMANSRYFSSHCNAIAQIRKKDATQVDASPLRADFDKDDLKCWNGNIDWVINGSKKKKKE